MKTKTMLRFYTIADFSEEEEWLREENKKGWKLTQMKPPCFYYFEECVPEDVIYKLDYQDGKETKDYMKLFEDYGWEYVTKCVGWLYFRKSAKDVEEDNDAEIFSDLESKLNMIEHVIKTRMIPVVVFFLLWSFIYMGFVKKYILGKFFIAFFVLIFVFYTYILIRCGIKFMKKRKQLKK